MSWRPNAPAVVSETIDGEVIVIHLERGSYFSLRGSAAELWELVEKGCDPDAVAEALAGRYSASPSETVVAAAERFLEELREEGLVVESSDAPAAVPALEPATTEFSPPQLEKYTDLEDLIMMDPIHEVEPEGWPAPRQSA
jgi:hypothetical protein